MAWAFSEKSSCRIVKNKRDSSTVLYLELEQEQEVYHGHGHVDTNIGRQKRKGWYIVRAVYFIWAGITWWEIFGRNKRAVCFPGGKFPRRYFFLAAK